MSQANNFKVFLITEGININTRTPRQIFLSRTYQEARMFFEHKIQNLPDNKKIEFYLYKIAELDKKLNILSEPYKIYITGGAETIYKKELVKTEKELIEKAAKAKTNKEQIEILFGGKQIEN